MVTTYFLLTFQLSYILKTLEEQEFSSIKYNNLFSAIIRNLGIQRIQLTLINGKVIVEIKNDVPSWI